MHPFSRGLVAVAWCAQRLKIIERVCPAVRNCNDVIHFVGWYYAAISQTQHAKPAVTLQGSNSEFLPLSPIGVGSVLLRVPVSRPARALVHFTISATVAYKRVAASHAARCGSSCWHDITILLMAIILTELFTYSV